MDIPSNSEMIPKPLHLLEPLCSSTIGSLGLAAPALPHAFLRDEPCGRTLPARALSRFFKMSEAAIRLFETKLELAEGSCEVCGLDCLLTCLQTFILTGAEGLLLCLVRIVDFSWARVGSVVLKVRSHLATGPNTGE